MSEIWVKGISPAGVFAVAFVAPNTPPLSPFFVSLRVVFGFGLLSASALRTRGFRWSRSGKACTEHDE